MDERLGLVLASLLAACGDAPPADGGPPDGGLDAGGSDGGAPDASRDAGPPWRGPGCSETAGIECDGDWTPGYCDPPCEAGECCSPRGGRFDCAPRGPGGSCPAANIWVDTDRITDAYEVQWRYFAPDDCALVEGCVVTAGWRRLLRFGTWTPNTGDADLYLGIPGGEPPFVYSACHDHHHFEGYAQYELRALDGTVVADGHKQAFCLLDFYRYPGTDGTGAVYDCGHQGIQRGWQDVYGESLDCQWVDVTDVPPGDYVLRIDLNVDRVLLESSYDDNRAEVPVTIGEDMPVDVTEPCAMTRTGTSRDCGWNAGAAPYPCTPGEPFRAGCSTACGLGACTGDTVLRVCDPAVARMATDCAGMAVLASNDDSGCGGGDLCSRASFTCPAGGSVTVFWGAYDSSNTTATCTVAVAPVAP